MRLLCGTILTQILALFLAGCGTIVGNGQKCEIRSCEGGTAADRPASESTKGTPDSKSTDEKESDPPNFGQPQAASDNSGAEVNWEQITDLIFDRCSPIHSLTLESRSVLVSLIHSNGPSYIKLAIESDRSARAEHQVGASRTTQASKHYGAPDTKVCSMEEKELVAWRVSITTRKADNLVEISRITVLMDNLPFVFTDSSGSDPN